MKNGPAHSRAGKGKSLKMPIVVAFGGVAVVIVLTLLELIDSGRPPEHSVGLDSVPYAAIDYYVDHANWGSAAPRLCDIVDRYGLGDDAFAATLHLNGGGSGCASPDMRAPPGSRIALAVTARSGFAQCRELAQDGC